MNKPPPVLLLVFNFLPLLLLLGFSAHHLVPVLGDNYVPTDKILLSCGGPPESTDSDGRKWYSDTGSKFALSISRTSTSPAALQKPSVPTVPYMNARIFTSPFTYTFPVAPGRKFIRLYFYPASYNNLTASNAVFSVTAGPFQLMKNFSAEQTTEALNYDYITKEFSVYVPSEVLNLTFTPSSSPADAYAFVNGIEVVSHPDIYSTLNTNTPIVGQAGTSFDFGNNTALENLYRLNVGGNAISPSSDTGLFRSWNIDSPYIFGAATGVTNVADPNVTITYPAGTPSFVAPLDVYSTFRTMGPDSNVNKNYNLTWIFSVDSGFFYLVRLHFCEGFQNISLIHQREFKIFLYNRTAQPDADVIAWGVTNGKALHKDYVVFVPSTGGAQPQQDMWLALTPNTESKPYIYDAILNGLEIFKINDTSGNLGGPNPIPAPIPPAESSESSAHSKNHSAIIGGGVGGGIAAVLLVGGLLVCLVSRSRQKHKKDSSTSDGWLPLSLYGNSHSSASAKTNTTGTGSYASSLPSNLCRHFSFAEIKAATKNFDEALVLGVGGFGKVYRGEIDGGTKVAIKRGNPLSEQGVHEFQTEIEMLSKLRHRHLVSLIGYCEENCEMILVYDYMAHGTLREHLYKTQKPPLPWKQRLEIGIGAARGLHYLHTGAKHTIIHRDVKTTNILLDEKWVAKVSDFGLSKTGPTLDHTHVSTVVKGSFGYLDPEYFRRQQLTDKSDVYSFGVVLFEILCARPALNPTLPKEQVSLAEWAFHCYKKGILDQIMDPYLKGKIAPECFKKVAETAVKCVADVGIDRPSMGDVLWNLEFALQLQESAEESGKGLGMGSVDDLEHGPFVDDDTCKKGKKDPNAVDESSGNMEDSRSTGISMSIGGQSLASEDSEGLTPSAVFSQIMNPKGR
ncbi:OLC1v1033522C1 [Oldenlandia corymbosa var. corymbosa]|uniref:non-specific serine/threonine protein kinase n=1 Tax=Oldenlandia corymbosa var. corymbosa TaxID=529605 RepID=A0AAV1CPW9_OLDCO|nr:OLC1v1033522C1 [Oldenlandia corymbosa var. corymbosa]